MAHHEFVMHRAQWEAAIPFAAAAAWALIGGGLLAGVGHAGNRVLDAVRRRPPFSLDVSIFDILIDDGGGG